MIESPRNGTTPTDGALALMAIFMTLWSGSHHSDPLFFRLLIISPPKIKRFDSSRWGGGSDGHLYDFAKRQSGSLSKKFDPSRWLLVLVLLFLLPSRLCCCFCYCCPKSLIPPDGTLALMATFKTLLPTKGSTPRGGAAALTAIFMTLLRSRSCLLPPIDNLSRFVRRAQK